MLFGLLSAVWLTRSRPRGCVRSVQRLAKTEVRRSREEERQEEKRKKQVEPIYRVAHTTAFVVGVLPSLSTKQAPCLPAPRQGFELVTAG
jgi:hypothetical protein